MDEVDLLLSTVACPYGNHLIGIFLPNGNDRMDKSMAYRYG